MSRSPAIAHTVLALGGFAIGLAEFASMSLLPDFTATFGVDAPTGGRAISAYALGVVVGAPILTVMAAKMSRHRLLIVLMALFALANGACALAPNFPTFIVFRFIAGLPHGAYFGVAALVAAGLVAPNQRAAAVGKVLLGLTIATIIGVPIANLIGQWIGWRWSFALVTGSALLTSFMVWRMIPADPPLPDASPLRELSALGRIQVWLTLGIGAIGFGGLFAVYTYLASTLTEVTRASPLAIPVVLAMFGVGMTAGNIFIPRLADRHPRATTAGLLLWSAVILAIYPFTAYHLWSITLAVMLIGLGGALGAILQTRLMDVAGEGQTLAAALNHSAFNAANALGPALGGAAIAAGYGWTSTGFVGSALALGGLAIWAVSFALECRQTARLPT